MSDDTINAYTSVERLGLSEHVKNSLLAENVFKVEELIHLGRKRLLEIPSLGKSGLKEIEDKLSSYGEVLQE